MRATAEAGAAKFGAASAKPAEQRPPDALARLQKQHHAESTAVISSDRSNADPDAEHSGETAVRASPSERFARDYRMWGRQPSPNSATVGSKRTPAGMQKAEEGAPQKSMPAHDGLQGSGHALAIPGSPSKSAPGAGNNKARAAREQVSENAGSRTAVGKPAEKTGKAGASKRQERASSRYKTEGREMYIRSGVWQSWGPAAAASEAASVKPPNQSNQRENRDGVVSDLGSRTPPESPISWGLYARSYASVQGKLSPALRGQPGKAAARRTDQPQSPATAETVESTLDHAGDLTVPVAPHTSHRTSRNMHHSPKSIHSSSKQSKFIPLLGDACRIRYQLMQWCAGGHAEALGNIVPSRTAQTDRGKHKAESSEQPEGSRGSPKGNGEMQAEKQEARQGHGNATGGSGLQHVLGKEAKKMSHALRSISFPSLMG